jgi:hypothetical protein
MNYEIDTLDKLSKRLVHTSNQDVALISNSRVPVEGKKRVLFREEDDQDELKAKPKNKHHYENYQELMVF